MTHYLEAEIDVDAYLEAADRAIGDEPVGSHPHPVHIGVDLGTAYTVVFVLDNDFNPVAGTYEFAQVIRDGVVLDFYGAVSLVRKLKERIERRLGYELTGAATCYPPGVSAGEVKAARYVLESAGLVCRGVVDEPSAANAVLRIENGAVVDIGGFHIVEPALLCARALSDH